MIKIENVEIYGLEAAVRGMRNPKNSWDKSDSKWEWVEDPSPINPNDPGMCFIVGDNDMKLMKSLCKAGSDHRKFLRFIAVTCDITAPLYWWKEYDTYKVGTVTNSCSTMHKIADKEFVLDDFSHEHLMTDRKTAASELLDTAGKGTDILVTPASWLNITVALLNNFRERYLETKDKEWWWQMIQLLPSSYNQRRTVMLNYEVLRNQYHARKNHKLDCWRQYCKWIESLPYAKELIVGEECE